MNLTRIKALDLRPDWIKIHEKSVEAHRAQEAELDKMWNWPSAPLFVQHRHIEVTITADTTEFRRSLADLAKTFSFMGYNPAHELSYARLALQQMVATKQLREWHPVLSVPVQGGSLLWKPWGRWNIAENWWVYGLVMFVAYVIGVLLGSYPWH